MRIDEIAGLPEKCTGCFACYQVCPVHAIRKKQQRDGFYIPKINTDICTSCGLCAKVCRINDKKETTTAQNIYSVQANDEEVRARASSGGVFELLSKKVMDNGGVVFGAFFDSKTKTVRHTSTDKTELVHILRSKYVQSDTEDTFKEVGTAMQNGRVVLYCGTPCQIQGLKNFLKAQKIDGILYTVDFFCHGVPSPLYFSYMLADIENQENKTIVDFTFREKDNGWREQTLKAYFQDGSTWKSKSLEHYYYYFFLNNYTLRDSCYRCNLYNCHVSDITLADDWQQKNGDDKGTSLVLCNTDSGVNLFANISDQCEITPLATDFNYELYSHATYDYRKKQNWCLQFEKTDFEGVSRTYFKKVKKAQERKQLVRYLGGTLKRKIKQLIKK